jgi:DNA-binding GntR family transcriptional regulator
VREALNRLTNDEFVVQIDQRGFRVADASLDQLDDLTRTRCLLEGLCLRDAIARDAPAWREGLDAAFLRLERIEAKALADPEVTYAEWEDAHRAFHAALIAGGSSAILRKLCAQLWMMAERYRHLAGRSGPATGPGRGTEHRDLARAALEGNAEGAAALLDRHYRRTAEAVRDALTRSAG